MGGKLRVDEFDMRVVNFLTGWGRNTRNRAEATLFVIASLPRSGTHMLCSLLNGHAEIRTESELFNPYSDHNKRRLRRSAEWVFKYRVWYDGPQRIRGLPIHLNHDDPWKVWRYLKGVAGVRFLCMRRRNVLAQFVSHDQAMVHQRWQVWQGGNRPQLKPMPVDPQKFAEFFEQVQSCWDRFDEEFAARERMTVWYEDLCQQTEAVSLEVQSFLGASPLKGLQPGTIKVGRPLGEVVSNYADLKRHFSGSRYESFLEVAAANQVRRAA